LFSIMPLVSNSLIVVQVFLLVIFCKRMCRRRFFFA